MMTASSCSLCVISSSSSRTVSSLPLTVSRVKGRRRRECGEGKGERKGSRSGVEKGQTLQLNQQIKRKARESERREAEEEGKERGRHERRGKHILILKCFVSPTAPRLLLLLLLLSLFMHDFCTHFRSARHSSSASVSFLFSLLRNISDCCLSFNLP